MNTPLIIRLYPGGGGAGCYVVGTREFEFTKDRDGTSKRKALAAAEKFAAENPDPMTVDPRTGQPLTTTQRQHRRQQVAEHERHAAKVAERRAAGDPNPNKYQRWVDQLLEEGPGYGPGAKAKWEKRLDQARRLAAQEDTKLKEETKQAAIEKDPRFDELREMIGRRMLIGTDTEVEELGQASAHLKAGNFFEANDIIARVTSAQVDRQLGREKEALDRAREAASEYADQQIATRELQGDTPGDGGAGAPAE